jgi:hypothetical protein
MRPDARLALAAALIMLALLPPLSSWLTARLATHILGQYLLLASGGALIGTVLGRRADARWTAAPALLVALFTLGFWLLPRWIDAALVDPLAAATKPLALVLLAGLPLGWGWAQAGPLLRGFAVANGASMLLVMGWLQQAVPQRLCNAYLLSDQRTLGLGFLVLAVTLIAGVLLHALLDRRPAARRGLA